MLKTSFSVNFGNFLDNFEVCMKNWIFEEEKVLLSIFFLVKMLPGPNVP